MWSYYSKEYISFTNCASPINYTYFFVEITDNLYDMLLANNKDIMNLGITSEGNFIN